MKDFSDFRDNWLTPEKEKEIMGKCLEQTKCVSNDDTNSALLTFSATYSLLLLAEYHDWANR